MRIQPRSSHNHFNCNTKFTMAAYTDVDKVTSDLLVSRQNPLIYPEAFAHFGPDRVFLPKFFAQSAELIENLQVREDDLWICSFIKVIHMNGLVFYIHSDHIFLVFNVNQGRDNLDEGDGLATTS